MKYRYIILTALIVSCETRPKETLTNDVKDSLIQDSLHAKINTSDRGLGDFVQFFERFKTDSVFQLERVKFPLTMLVWQSEDEPLKKESVKKKDWKYSSFDYQDSLATRQIDAYTQKIKIYGDTVKLEIRGVDNGIYTDYEFTKVDNQWYLIGLKDLTN